MSRDREEAAREAERLTEMALQAEHLGDQVYAELPDSARDLWVVSSRLRSAAEHHLRVSKGLEQEEAPGR